MKSKWEPISYEEDGFYYTVILRYDDMYDFGMDVSVNAKYKDVVTDWSQFQFLTSDPVDMMRMNIQNSVDNFDEASSLAVCLLEKEGLIRQDENANWYDVKRDDVNEANN